MAVRGLGSVGAKIQVPGFGRRTLHITAWSGKGREPEYTMGGFVCGRKGHTAIMKAFAKLRDWAEEVSVKGYDVWAQEQRTRDAIKGKFGEVPRSPVGEIGETVPGGNGVWTDRKKRKK